MKHASLPFPVLCAGALFLAACHATVPETLVLSDADVQVKIEARRSAKSYELKQIDLHAAGPQKALAVHLSIFDDRNADGTLQEGERLGAWHASSAVPTEHMSMVGMLSASEVPPEVLERLHIETRVELAAGTSGDAARELSAVRAFPGG